MPTVFLVHRLPGWNCFRLRALPPASRARLSPPEATPLCVAARDTASEFALDPAVEWKHHLERFWKM